MLPDRDLMENIAASPMHTALSARLKDSGVAAALKANGQFTVFAPTNAAFAAAGTAAQVQPGAAHELSDRAGQVRFPGAAQGRSTKPAAKPSCAPSKAASLVARMNGPTNIVVMDEKGNTADIAIYDVRDKNGIIHVVDRMLEPGGPARQVASTEIQSVRVFRQIIGERLRRHVAGIGGRENIVAIDQLAVRRGDQQRRARLSAFW